MSTETNSRWPGFSDEEALAWSRVLIHHSPEPQRAMLKALMNDTNNEGRAVRCQSWIRTATAAREDGFTPELYRSLFEALRTSKARNHPSHPANRKITHASHIPGIPYESELWAGYPKRVFEEDFSLEEAAEVTLLLADPKFPKRE